MPVVHGREWDRGYRHIVAMQVLRDPELYAGPDELVRTAARLLQVCERVARDHRQVRHIGKNHVSILVSTERDEVCAAAAAVRAAITPPPGIVLVATLCHEYVREWPTPLLRPDILGSAAAAAMRACHECVRDCPDPGAHLHASDGNHQLWPPQHRDGDYAAVEDAAVTVREGFVVVGNLRDSRGLFRDDEGLALWHLREALREHVPAALALCQPAADDAIVKLSRCLHFEYTGDGFELVVFLGRDPRALLDWLSTLVLDLWSRELPMRFSAGLGALRCIELHETTLHEQGALVIDGPELDRCRVLARGAAQPDPTASVLRLTHELTAVLPAEIQRALAPDRDDGRGRHALGRAGLDRLVAALDGDAPPPFRSRHPGAPRRAIVSSEVFLGTQRLGSQLRRVVAVEAALTAAVALPLVGHVSPREVVIVLGVVVLVAGLYGWMSERHSLGYLSARVLPTLPRTRFAMDVRDRAMRSVLRIRFALLDGMLGDPTTPHGHGAAPPGYLRRVARRARALWRELGWHTWFWGRWIVARGGARTRRSLTYHLPRPHMRLGLVAHAVVGIGAYAGATVIGLGFLCAPDDPTAHCVRAGVVAIVLGVIWCVAFFHHLRSRALYPLYLSRLTPSQLAREGTSAGFQDYLPVLGLVTCGFVLSHCPRVGPGQLTAIGIGWGLLTWRAVEHVVSITFLRRKLLAWVVALGSAPRPLPADVVPGDLLQFGVGVLAGRGDLLHRGMSALHAARRDLELDEAQRMSAADEAMWFITDQHGHVLLSRGEMMRGLGWGPDDRMQLAQLYGEGQRAARVVRDLVVQLADIGVSRRLSLAASLAGPVRDGLMKVQACTLTVTLLPGEGHAVGYLAIAVPRGQPTEVRAFQPNPR